MKYQLVKIDAKVKKFGALRIKAIMKSAGPDLIVACEVAP
jgi:hypothetical protein